MKVYQAIAAVMAELAKEGISKDRKNQQQGYNFRGIDDMYNALSGPLSKHGLVIIPKATERQCEERQSTKGSPLFYVTVRVDFTIVSAEDGSHCEATMYGEAMDSADKATNKAMSAAYKYLAMELFCIPTEGDNDADSTTHHVAAKPELSKSVALTEFDKLSPGDQEWLRNECMVVKKHLAFNRPAEAAEALDILAKELDAETKVAAWSLFDSGERRKLKEATAARAAV